MLIACWQVRVATTSAHGGSQQSTLDTLSTFPAQIYLLFVRSALSVGATLPCHLLPLNDYQPYHALVLLS